MKAIYAISLLALTFFCGATGFPTRIVEARAGTVHQQQPVVEASRTPAVVFIMRHAEKPLGEDKQADLTPTGFKRASALPTLFLQQPGSTKLPRLPRPDAIFATEVSKHSNRPIETVTPLAQALHLSVNHDYGDHQFADVAAKVLSGKYAGKVVLICWHHGEIPHLAQAFGVTDAPAEWDPAVFDRIWMVEWIDGKARYTSLPEELLPGDSTK